jgi:hypothetical protein
LADNYPIVRFFAANGLAKAPWQVVKPDYLADANARAQIIQQWRALLGQKSGSVSQQAELLANKLKALRHDVDLEVGE